MNSNDIQDATFSSKDISLHPLTKGVYENCTFVNCNFSSADLSGCTFIDCTFTGCNLSLAVLNDTAMRDALFIECKMTGLRFDSCAPFGLSFSFDRCVLNHSSFAGTKIKKTVFKHTQPQDVDFAGCDLTGSLFDRCDLRGAAFDRTILEKADVRTSTGYSIDPERNRIKKAKFSLHGVAGLLHKHDIIIER